MRPKLTLVAFILIFIYLSGSPVQGQQLLHRVILIGDAGEIKDGKNTVAEAVLKSSKLNRQTSVIFLGDNIYPAGLPGSDAPGYEKYKAVLEAQLQLARQSPSQVYFIPGNHDWAKGRTYGLQYALNQQHYIDSAGLPNARFIPAGGCPGPEEIPLAPGVVLVAINSQWWLHSGEKPGVESDCDCKTGDEVNAKLKDIAYRHAGDIIILASHHPFKTYGPHGGYFTLRQHLFPLTDANNALWLPLPVIGSIYPVTRGVFGNIQDVKHPLYKKMIRQVTEPFQNHSATFFVHGHDHNLQYIQNGSRRYIVSGSGAKNNAVKKGKGSEFASTLSGYTVMDVFDDGNVATEFYSDKNQLLFSKAGIVERKAPQPLNIAGRYAGKDSVTVSANKDYDKASGLKRWLFGQSYRKVWAEPVSFRVFNIQHEKGGLKILQKGGGKQTKSLRLEDKNGTQWVLRSINKNPVSALPPALRESFALDVVQDQISAAHPYAPLVVPVLAEAAGVPHARPELVWVPADTAFGAYTADFANSLCLFEEREPGITGKSYSTAKVLEALLDDNDNKTDQQAVLKVRLFDMFISDWDRHEDQWRWGAVKNEKGKTFYPVPRDRDQAFFINNGFITWFAAMPNLVPSAQGMRKKYRNINSFNFSTRYFDRNFLNLLTEDDWRRAAETIVAALTDEVIDKAVDRLPAAINNISGAALRNTLKGKRQYFVQDAITYCRFLNRTIEITGSDKKERFEIVPAPGSNLLLNVYKLTKSDGDTVLMYRRMIDTRITTELRLYGMDGADQFVTSPEVHAKLRVRIIGGRGKDVYKTAADIRTAIYDLETEANDLSQSGSAAVNTAADPAVNNYNRTAYQYNQNIPQLVFGFNPDDGLSLGAGVKVIRHGFRKSPKAVYQFGGSHSLSTAAFRFTASAAFNRLIGKTGLTLYADIKSPNNTTNFFGYGNASVYNNPGKNTFRFHRARYNLAEAGLSFVSTFARTLRLQYGAGYQFYSLDADDNKNRYIIQTGVNGLAADNIFKKKHYLSGHLGITADNRNNINVPTRGILWSTSLQPARGLNNFSKNSVTLQSDLRVYASLNNPARLVLAARAGAGHIWGDFEFFQALQLGNHSNLRGFRNHRFAGRSMAYGNVELRLKLFDFEGYLFPGTVGLIAFNDVGRVWADTNQSSVWHNTPGAGIYLSPAGLVVISATVGFSKEETLPFISMGFRF